MGNVDSDDEELWRRSLANEGDAFGRLFDRHRERVFRHAYRLCQDRHDAQDVMATAFLELWRRREKVRLVDGSVLPWLLVTTTNVGRNARRAAWRYRKLLDSLPRDPTVEDAAEEIFSRNPLEAVDPELAEALRTLNALDRQLFSLVILEGYTVAAAATVLGLSASAAKTRMHLARLRMKKALGGPSRNPGCEFPSEVRP
jgi:RNA polymerase sigma factor (sigma-70 family)